MTQGWRGLALQFIARGRSVRAGMEEWATSVRPSTALRQAARGDSKSAVAFKPRDPA